MRFSGVLALLALVTLMFAKGPAPVVNADGPGGNTADCGSTIVTTDPGTSSFTAPAGNIVTGVCFRVTDPDGAGPEGGPFPADGGIHSELITSDGTVIDCYDVDGIGTASVTVTALAGEDCTAVTHLDVNYEAAPTATAEPTATATTEPEPEAASITVELEANGFDDAALFRGSLLGGDPFELEDDEARTFDVEAGAYLLRIDPVAGWNLTDIDCDEADTNDRDIEDLDVEVVVDEGEDARCVFVLEEAPAPAATPVPPTATPVVIVQEVPVIVTVEVEVPVITPPNTGSGGIR